MKDWFKARNIWGAAIAALTDEEAGRLAKAIWSYTMTGKIKEIEGAEKGIYAMILLTLGQDAERDDDISAKRSVAAKNMHLQANAYKSNQLQANADNKNKNKNIDKEQESESESEFITDAEAQQLQMDQNRVLDAAEDAGFKMSNSVRASLTALFADCGLERMLEGIRSCSEHGAVNLAYLRAVLSGKQREQKQKPKVEAQNYEQRDYADVQTKLVEEQRKRFEERLKGVG